MNDKRSVATDALETLGTIIDETAARDAIHLAVEPAVAGMTLRAGEHVGFLADGTVGVCDKPLGIVDPFLQRPVQAGERFWWVVYPRQITSLRHVWSHPQFEGRTLSYDFETEPMTVHPAFVPYDAKRIVGVTAEQAATSEAWLRKFCDEADCPGYEDVMALIMNRGRSGDYKTGEYLHFDERDAHGEIPAEFWNHVENVTGYKFEERPSFFSCSC